MLPEAHWDLNVAQDPTGGTAVRHEATWAADVVSRCGLPASVEAPNQSPKIIQPQRQGSLLVCGIKEAKSNSTETLSGGETKLR